MNILNGPRKYSFESQNTETLQQKMIGKSATLNVAWYNAPGFGKICIQLSTGIEIPNHKSPSPFQLDLLKRIQY